jgi:hypothetical protein
MLTGTVDKPNVTVELSKSDMVVATLTASGDYAGTVNIAASLVDATMTPIPGVTVSAQPTAALTTNGTAMVPVMLAVAPNAAGADVTGTLKIDITGGPAPINLSSTIAVSAVFTVIYPDGAGSTVANHQLVGAAINIKRGAIIRFKNEDTTPGAQHITHGGPLFPHESTAATSGLLGDVYDVPTEPYSPGSVGQLGCHDHESSNSYITFTIE